MSGMFRKGMIGAAALGIVAAIAFVSCSKSGTGGVDEDVEFYPADITDLQVVSVSPTSLKLKWTAPGDSENIGTAAEYDLRYAKREVTWGMWDSSAADLIPVTGEPHPSVAGATDSMTVTGLTEDSTYYFAIKAKNSIGKYSWLSNCASGTCFNDFSVTFPDSRLDQLVRSLIGKPSGPIHRTDLADVQFIASTGDSVADLTGLEYCPKLQALYLSSNRLTSLAPLAGLRHLVSLQVASNQISDISPLAAVTTLEQLIISDNDIADISALTNLNALADVNLAGNQITSISALANKSLLTHLVAERNSISDISPLAASVNLTDLNLRQNQITTIGVLSGMTKLVHLYLDGNQINSLTGLGTQTELVDLNLSNNQITDISPLAGLNKLWMIYLQNNQIHQVRAVASLPKLEYLYLNSNPLSDIDSLAGLQTIKELQMAQCGLTQILCLEHPTTLHRLILVLNDIVDLEPLVNNTGFATNDTLFISGNFHLSDASKNIYIPELEDRGAVVVQ